MRKFKYKKILYEFYPVVGDKDIVAKKEGIFFGKVEHREDHWKTKDSKQMCVIKLKGEEHPIVVPLTDITFLKNDRSRT